VRSPHLTYIVHRTADEQFGPHRYDANQHFFGGLNSFQKSKSFGHQGIQAGCAFDGRAAYIIKEFGPLASLSSPIAFGGI
jgi:hypothetical protein